jgi:hypothetical protein
MIKPWVVGISWAMMFIVGVSGIMFLQVLFHEYSHYNDLHSFVKNDSICLFYIENPSKLALTQFEGRYSYQVEDNSSQQWLRADRTTEYRAYTVTFGVLLLFGLCFMSILLKFVDMKLRLKYGVLP